MNGGLPDFVNVRGYGGTDARGLKLASSVGPRYRSGLLLGRSRAAARALEGKARRQGREPRRRRRAARSMGVDGVWVSNHGGRQLDGAIASLDAMAIHCPRGR
jgi:L-lactate dehydrogenase (cytochrome)/(S)-mandelate dehydrogenase